MRLTARDSVKLCLAIFAWTLMGPVTKAQGDAATLPRIVIEREPAAASREVSRPPGALEVVGAGGRGTSCPLRHTDVKARVSGFIARVWVRQEFVNPSVERSEARYSFPLPQDAAVDDMTMRVGGRTIRGKIMRRDEAEAVYAEARAAGQTASLLAQQRPNVFTQSVANVMPGERVVVEISYVELLKYEDGEYQFIFPLTVAPRYAPDASLNSSPAAAPGTRAGHDVSLEISIAAGVPLSAIRSVLHDVDARGDGAAGGMTMTLSRKAEVPNRDFILKYQTAGQALAEGLLAHRAGRGGFFTLILQPPARIAAEELTPKELIFVLDTSGSMQGFPLEKAQETMHMALAGLNQRDTFNLITFSGDTRLLFSRPVPATAENLRHARQFLASRQGEGGTEMMSAIRAALAPSDAPEHVRVVCFMTDGLVGNDLEILAEVRRHQNARVFAMGFGHAPNRFLLDRMAELGRGEVEYVAPDGDGSAAARRFHERVRSPLLTDITIEWNGLPVSDVEPRRLPDLFSAKPLFVTGRYAAGGRGLVRLRGRMAGRDVVRELEVELPDVEPRHEVLATLWARRRIEALMARNFEGVQQGVVSPPLEAAITELGLRFRLLTQFTSFVAVEERAVNRGGELRMIEVPVEAPGVDQRDSAPLAGYGPSGAPAAGVETANAFSMSEMIRNVGPVQIALTLALLLASLACLRFALGRAPTLWLRWRHTRRFAPALNSALRDGRIEEVLALSEECRRAPRAEVVRAGLQCWHARGPGESPSELEIKLSQSAAERLIAMRGYEERRRLSWLASVGTTAPLVGLFATVWGLIAVLSGAGYAEAAGIGAVAGGVAEALLPTALSLGVAVAAVWLHCYFSRQTDECVFEMSCAAADVRDYLLKRRVARSRVGGRQGA